MSSTAGGDGGGDDRHCQTTTTTTQVVTRYWKHKPIDSIWTALIVSLPIWQNQVFRYENRLCAVA
jgi:hypothetical protein